MIKIKQIFVCLLFLFISINSAVRLSSGLTNQRITGNIYGQVFDVERTPLPGITIDLISKETGVVLATTISSSDGSFRFNNLDIGKYNIKITQAGFKTKIIENISVNIGMNSSLEIIMDTGIIDTGNPPAENEKILIQENQKIFLKNNKLISNDKGTCYYSRGNLIAENGISNLGKIERNLSRITEIPYADEDYKKEKKLEKGEVYVIRFKKNNDIRIVIVRVLEINNKRLSIEFYVGD
ncbi:MAG: carboxypeptidase-like regulatory domain-containing protein [Candidatus Aminicenantales bacterium]